MKTTVPLVFFFDYFEQRPSFSVRREQIPIGFGRSKNRGTRIADHGGKGFKKQEGAVPLSR
jgi:hypothetical protein